MAVTEVLASVAAGLLVYVAVNWWKDPLRKIPGPAGIPIFGNALMLDPKRMHMQLYEMARIYGPIMKISIFSKPIVVLNSTDVCLEALIKKGTDFLGRPPAPRIRHIVRTNVAFTSFDHPKYPILRRVTTKALRSYGVGVAKLERVVQDTLQDVMEVINNKDGEPFDTYQLTYGYVCCVMTSIIFGEKYSFDDPVCRDMHEMNRYIVNSADPSANESILDLYPSLFKYKFLFRTCHQTLDEAVEKTKDHVLDRIQEAKAAFSKQTMHGCLDYFIESQREEGVDENGEPILDDDCIVGLMLDFFVGGMETSQAALSQIFLDLVHDKALIHTLQAEIDEVFEPGHTFTMQDRERLPRLEAYTHEMLRLLTQLPLLLPHSTIRDTDIGGYQIPAGTRVFFNSFHSAHDPEVFADPFVCKPERYLDENGQVVPPGHPFRRSFFGFGAGRRQCPGELLARSRIFLLLANILQKFDIEAAGEPPKRDIRDYKMNIIIQPPAVSARFIPRHHN